MCRFFLSSLFSRTFFLYPLPLRLSNHPFSLFLSHSLSLITHTHTAHSRTLIHYYLSIASVVSCTLFLSLCFWNHIWICTNVFIIFNTRTKMETFYSNRHIQFSFLKIGYINTCFKVNSEEIKSKVAHDLDCSLECIIAIQIHTRLSLFLPYVNPEKSVTVTFHFPLRRIT